MAEFVERRSITRAAQFDGSTESVSNLMVLLNKDMDWQITNDKDGIVLRLFDKAGEFRLVLGSWLLIRYGDRDRVLPDGDFRRLYEPAK
jgi:hypothetical protein